LWREDRPVAATWRPLGAQTEIETATAAGPVLRLYPPSAKQRYVPHIGTGSPPVNRDVYPEQRSLRMYARVVVYTHQDDKVELEAKARAGVIPIVTSTPGYISYGVMFEDDRVVSISQWESEEHAKSADAELAEWVKANTTMTSQTRITGDLAWLELASR
jgi:heme-degrading monooxygenase HmoA